MLIYKGFCTPETPKWCMYSSCLLDSLNLKLNHHGFENQGLSFEGYVLSLQFQVFSWKPFISEIS